MNKITRIVILVAIILASIAILAFYAFKSKAPVAPLEETKVTTPVKQAPAASREIPPLPRDINQAIDSELKGIDQTLDETEASLSSDSEDAELGL